MFAPLQTSYTYGYGTMHHAVCLYVQHVIQVNQKRASLRKLQCGYELRYIWLHKFKKVKNPI